MVRLLNQSPKFIDSATVREQVADADALRHQLEADPFDPIAAEQLEGVYRAEGDWQSLIELLVERAEESEDARECASVLFEVAGLYDTKLGEKDLARVVLLEAFALQPSERAIADSLDQLAYATGEWNDVIEAYMLAAGKLRMEAPEIASDLWLRVACANIISGDYESVTEALDRVSTLNPTTASAYLDMVERSANSTEVLETLSQMCARIGDVDRMARTLSRAAATAPDSPARAYFHHRLGELKNGLGEVEAAAWHYGEALRLDRSRSDALEALANIHRQRGDYRALARLLESQRAFANDRRERLALLFEAASIYEDELDENTHAIDLYASALAIDPAQVGAALPMAERYYREERWSELAPVVDLLIQRRDRLGAELSVAELYRRAARCSRELGLLDQATERYRSALELEPERVDTICDLAAIEASLNHHSTAESCYRAALERARTEDESADLHAKIGDVRRDAGDLDGALGWYEGAYRARRDPETLAAIADIHTSRGDWAALVRTKQAQLDQNTCDNERSELLSEMAYVVARKLDDPYGAIDLYRRAVSADPSNRAVLHQLAELYSAAQMWPHAVRVIVAIGELEENPLRSGKYFQAAGTIARHHLGYEDALAYYNRALDRYFCDAEPLPESTRAGCMKAFTDIGKMLYRERAFKELERNYRRMIKRLDADAPELAELWHGLGQIYRKHLQLRDSAISSFEVAAELDSDRQTNHRILIDLYDESPERIGDTIARRQRLLESEPFEAEHYRALRRLYRRAGQIDRVWMCCRALTFLGQAEAKEIEFYHQYLPREDHVPSAPLSEAAWARLSSKNEDRRLSNVFAICSEAVASAQACSPRRLGLGKPATADQQPLLQLFRRLNALMGVRPLDAYLADAGSLLLANVKRGHQLTPGLVLGPELWQGKGLRGVTHAMARTMAYTRAPYLLRLALPTPPELEAVLTAAIVLVRPAVTPRPELRPWVDEWVRVLDKALSPQARAALANEVTGLLLDPVGCDLDRWAASVDATCRRAALLAHGHLETAAAGYESEPGCGDVAGYNDACADLIVHSVSDAHAELRQMAGTALQLAQQAMAS